jgi:hypothetical protein
MLRVESAGLGNKKNSPWPEFSNEDNKSNGKIFSCLVRVKSLIIIEGNYQAFYPSSEHDEKNRKILKNT